jgi:hypothetical protein
MAQDYDKIFKENIEEIILPLTEKLLDIHPEKLEEIPDDLQRTIERKPDFLKKVVHKDNSKDFILQIEFQLDDDFDMVYRMLEYYSMLLRKYKLPVKQYIFYINSEKPKMPLELQIDELQFRFNLYNLQDVAYQLFIKSDKPEEIILAILGDFGNEKPEQVIRNVLMRLLEVSTEALQREKCFRQLEILSKLRKLQKEIIKQLEYMALTYDLETDIRFQQGSEKAKVEAIKIMLQDKIKIEKIAKYLNVSIDFVKQVENSMLK